jgi:hypothetical protein
MFSALRVPRRGDLRIGVVYSMPLFSAGGHSDALSTVYCTTFDKKVTTIKQYVNQGNPAKALDKKGLLKIHGISQPMAVIFCPHGRTHCSAGRRSTTTPHTTTRVCRKNPLSGRKFSRLLGCQPMLLRSKRGSVPTARNECCKLSRTRNSNTHVIPAQHAADRYERDHRWNPPALGTTFPRSGNHNQARGHWSHRYNHRYERDRHFEHAKGRGALLSLPSARPNLSRTRSYGNKMPNCCLPLLRRTRS